MIEWKAVPVSRQMDKDTSMRTVHKCGFWQLSLVRLKTFSFSNIVVASVLDLVNNNHSNNNNNNKKKKTSCKCC